jgi:hypothetical protein
MCVTHTSARIHTHTHTTGMNLKQRAELALSEAFGASQGNQAPFAAAIDYQQRLRITEQKEEVQRDSDVASESSAIVPSKAGFSTGASSKPAMPAIDLSFEEPKFRNPVEAARRKAQEAAVKQALKNPAGNMPIGEATTCKTCVVS